MHHLHNSRIHLEQLSGRLARHTPERALDSCRQRVDELELRAAAALRLNCVSRRRELENLQTALNTLNPMRQLERGYAMVLNADGSEVISTSSQKPGTELQLRFSDGTLGVKTL